MLRWKIQKSKVSILSKLLLILLFRIAFTSREGRVKKSGLALFYKICVCVLVLGVKILKLRKPLFLYKEKKTHKTCFYENLLNFISQIFLLKFTHFQI